MALSNLGLLLTAAKITNFITWSWWLVLLPYYGPVLMNAALAVTIVATGYETHFFKLMKQMKKEK